VEPVIAEHCRPEFVKNGVLLVSVPSGAFAQRVMSDATTILEGFRRSARGAEVSSDGAREALKMRKEGAKIDLRTIESYTISVG